MTLSKNVGQIRWFPFLRGWPWAPWVGPLPDRNLGYVPAMELSCAFWKVIWGHNSFFANNSWQYRDREAQMVPNDSAGKFGSEDMHIDLFGSWPDLTINWSNNQLMELRDKYLHQWVWDLDIILKLAELFGSAGKSATPRLADSLNDSGVALAVSTGKRLRSSW